MTLAYRRFARPAACDVGACEAEPPLAVDGTYSVGEDTALSIAAPGVLGNDTDPNGVALKYV